MILHVQGKKACLDTAVGRQPQRRIPDHDHGVLVLQALPRQITRQSNRRRADPRRQPVKLLGVGREGGPLAQRADQTPWITPVGRLVLPGRHHLALLGMSQWRVVEILTHIEFVQTNSAVGGERNVLCIG